MSDISFERLNEIVIASLDSDTKEAFSNYWISHYSIDIDHDELGKLKVISKPVGTDFSYHCMTVVPKHDLQIEVRPLKAYLGFNFYTSGSAVGIVSGAPSGFTMEEGNMLICVSNYGRGVLSLSKNRPFTTVTLFIKSQRFTEFVGSEIHHFPYEFSLALRDTNYFYSLGTATSDRLRFLLSKMESWFKGPTQMFYLESMAMEIMGATLSELELSQKMDHQFKKLDKERLLEAKSILEKSYKEAPSISELATMIGMNESKLKKGFKALFSTTIYQYLLDMRMERARMLLSDKELTVKETAYAIGYSNPNAFSNAFYQRFSVRPSEFSKKKILF